MPNRLISYIEKNKRVFSFDSGPMIDVLVLMLDVLYEGLDHYRHHLYVERDLAQIDEARKLLRYSQSRESSIEYERYEKQRILEGGSECWLDDVEPLPDNPEIYREKQRPESERLILLRERYRDAMAKEHHKKAKAFSDAMRIIGRHATSWWD